MRAVGKKRPPGDLRKPIIVFIGFPTTSFSIYSVALSGAFPDYACYSVPKLSALRDELTNCDVGLIITSCDECQSFLSMEQDLKAEFPSASLCIAYDSRAESPGCLRHIIHNHPRFSLLALDIRLDVLAAAISLMLSGGRYVQPDILVQQALTFQSDANDKIVGAQAEELSARLTPRENEVLALVADGLQNKLIADQLQLSEHTIKLHMHHIFSKLDVTNRTQAAAMYRRLQPALAK